MLNFTEHKENSDYKQKFNDIKMAWEQFLPIYIESTKKYKTLNFDPYFFDWICIFSPIESMVWSDIRYFGLPFFPQFPTCGYYLDFANPILKIAIECDGACYHDLEKDMQRDNVLIKNGWTIFRLTGKECNTIFENPFLLESDENNDEKIEKYFLNTSEGLISAIRKIIFNKNNERSTYDDICIKTLKKHLSKAHENVDFHSISYKRRNYD